MKIQRLCFAASALALSSCFAAVSDLRSITESELTCRGGVRTDVVRDLLLDLREMTPHRDQAFVGHVLSRETPTTQATLVGVVYLSKHDTFDQFSRATPMNRLLLTVPRMIPAGARNLSLNFYGDVSGTVAAQQTLATARLPVLPADLLRPQTNEPPRANDDHRWVKPLCDDGSLVFTHEASFSYENAVERNGGAFRMGAVNVRTAATLQTTVSIVSAAGVVNNAVVFARQRGAGLGVNNALILTIPNVLDNDLPYQVDVLVDQDSDGQAGADDVRCSLMLTSDRRDDAGITVQVVDNTCTIRAELPSP